jgi:hypothetical protein
MAAAANRSKPEVEPLHCACVWVVQLAMENAGIWGSDMAG